MDAQGLDQARVERRSKYTLTSHPLRWLSILLNVLLTAQIGSYNSISGQSIYGPIAESEALFYPIVVVMLLQSLGYVAVITPRCRTSLRELHTNFLSNSVYTFTNFSTYLEEHPNSALLYWMLAVTSCCLALFNGGFLLIDRLTCKEKVSGRLLSVNVSSVAAQSTSPCFFITDLNKHTRMTDLNNKAVTGSVWAWNSANIFELIVYLSFPGSNDCYNRYVSATLALSNLCRTLVINEVAANFLFPVFVLFRWVSMPIICREKHRSYCFSSTDQENESSSVEQHRVSVSH